MILDKILRSSQDSKQVSLTVKGILMQGVALIVMFGGASMDSNLLGNLAENISEIVGTVFLLIGQLQTVYGLVRKLF